MQRLSESKKLRGDGWQEKKMRQRLADYVADFLVKKGITDCFMVVGGGAMHLNDALGHKKGLHCTYNHHEQACAMAAEAYARVNNRIAAVCVTTGPGGTNALTGVLGGWLILYRCLLFPVRCVMTRRRGICSSLQMVCPYGLLAIRSLILQRQQHQCVNMQ